MSEPSCSKAAFVKSRDCTKSAFRKEYDSVRAGTAMDFRRAGDLDQRAKSKEWAGHRHRRCRPARALQGLPVPGRDGSSARGGQGRAARRARPPAAAHDLPLWAARQRGNRPAPRRTGPRPRSAVDPAPKGRPVRRAADRRRRLACHQAASRYPHRCVALAVRLRTRPAAHPPSGQLPDRLSGRARRLARRASTHAAALLRLCAGRQGP